MAGCYLLNTLLDQIETFVDCYLKTHGSSGPTDWESMLLISNGGVRLHVVIFVMETGHVIESHTFEL